MLFRLLCECSIVVGLIEQGKVQSGLAMLALMPDEFKALLGSLDRYPSVLIFKHNKDICVAWLVSMKVSMTAKGMFAVLEPDDITPLVMARDLSETCDFRSGCLARVRRRSNALSL